MSSGLLHRSRRWRDWSWGTKLSLLLGALAVVPLAAITWIDYRAAREERIDTARAQDLQEARGTAAAIDRYLTGTLADVRFIAAAPVTVHFLDGLPKTAAAGAELRAHAALTLQRMRETHGLAVLFLADPSGRVVLSTDARLQERNVISTAAFLDAISGRSLVHAPRYVREDGRLYLHASAPVRSADGRIVGAAIGRIRVSSLDTLVAEDTGFAGRGEYGVLWDANGVRLSHPTKPSLAFRPFEPLPGDDAARLVAEQRFGPGTRQLLQVKQAVPGLVERSRWLLYDRDLDPHVVVDAGQGPIHVAIVPLHSQRWLYGIFSPERAILAAVRAETRRALLATLITAVVALALASLLAQWATRPLRVVGQTANAIAAGDMSRRAGLRQADEVGRMAAAFDAMADALADKEAELRLHAERLEQRVAEQTAELRALVASEQEARRKAEEANRIKDEFLSTVSHELRTPLNAILGWASLLASGRLDEATAHRALAAVERNARSQSQIIDDLLDVSRIITGKLRLRVRRVRLAQPVDAAMEAVRPAADAKEIHLEARLDPEVTAGGDPDRLQQVVWNLLSNAVKFTPSGGRIEVRLEEAEGQAQIRVSDNGVGIAPGFLAYVFDRFRQADSSTTRTHGGLGLGLAIVRQLVELHGGTVQAESEGEGRGATFTVRLPLAPQAPEAAATAGAVAPPRLEPEPEEEEEEEVDLAGVRVLLVDDEPDARDVVSACLEQLGARVVAVPSAAEAIAALGRSSFDLLLADIGMPDEDGYGLIARVRGLEALRGLPAIALTAYAGDGDRRRALDAGFQIHLAKPVTPRALAAAVASLIHSSERRSSR